MEKPRSFSAKLINGAIAGVVGVSCTFPLDLAKTRLQDQRNLGPRKQYKHLVDCLWKVARAEGVQGLYKGIGVNLLLINPEKAIKLAVNDQVRQMYGGERRRLTLSKEMIAGGAAGFLSGYNYNTNGNAENTASNSRHTKPGSSSDA